MKEDLIEVERNISTISVWTKRTLWLNVFCSPYHIKGRGQVSLHPRDWDCDWDGDWRSPGCLKRADIPVPLVWLGNCEGAQVRYQVL